MIAVDTVTAAADTAIDLTLRGCLRRGPTTREQLALHLYERLYPSDGRARRAVRRHRARPERGAGRHHASPEPARRHVALWVAFVSEYVLRPVIAPSTTSFIRRTWWQILLLAVYAVVFFAALAGILGAYFVDHRREQAAFVFRPQ